MKARLLASLFALWSCSATAQQFFAGSISVSPQVSVTSCTAPCPVFVDLTNTTDPSTTFPFHERYYSTNFGDSGAGNWSYGSSNSVDSCGVGGQTTYCNFMPSASRNIGIGPVVGHVYNSPGTYLITTTVYGPGTPVSSIPVTIRVDNPDTIYGGNWSGATCNFGGANASPATSIGCTACVGAAFTNCTGGAGNNDPKSAGTTFSAIAADYLDATHSNRVLLHATESFSSGAAKVNVLCNRCQLGSFDSGAQPIIQSTAPANGTKVVGIGNFPTIVNNVTVQNVQVDAAADGNFCFDFAQGGSRILLFNLTCTSATGVINAVTPQDDSARLDEVYINSISWHGSGATIGGGGATCGAEVVYFRGATRVSMLGNDFEMADAMSQSMSRFQGWNKLEVGRSYYGRPCPARATIDIRGDTKYNATGILSDVITSQYANVWGNVAVGNSETGGGGNPGITIAPQFDGGLPNHLPDGPVLDVIIDGNVCWMGVTSSNGCIGIAQARNVTVRTSIVNGALRSGTPNTVPAILNQWTSTVSFWPQPQNIWFYFNNYNCISTITGEGMIKLLTQNVPGTVGAKNNINYCQSAAGVPTVINSSPSSSPITAGNSEQVGGSSTTSPQWSNGSGGYSLSTDYAVGLSTYKNAGVSGVPVFFDFAGKTVPKATPTIGALQ